jgi:hypothetical protein
MIMHYHITILRRLKVRLGKTLSVMRYVGKRYAEYSGWFYAGKAKIS